MLAQTWKLEGPLELEGRGFAYAGRVSWPYRLLERQGVLQGGLEGQGLSVRGSLRTDYAGLPLSATLQAEGADLERLRVALELPEGRVQLAQKQVVFDLGPPPGPPLPGRGAGPAAGPPRPGGGFILWRCPKG